MATTTNYGSRIMTGLVATPSTMADPGEGGGKPKKWVETVETAAADSIGSTYLIARLPSCARIFGASEISHDALGSTTTTIDIGIVNPPGENKITNDVDALNDGIVASTAGDKKLLKDRANWGKRLWEYVANQTTDPGGDLDIQLILADAHLSSGAGTITVEIVYATD